MREKAAIAALGKWHSILPALGVPKEFLTNTHGPCPMCGGKDRFHFDDIGGRGTWFCNHCGAGDGIGLVMRIRGCDFRTAAQEVERVAGVVRPGPRSFVPDEAKRIARLRQVWGEAKPLVSGDEGVRYLEGRGLTLDAPLDCLRLHPSLSYRDGETVIGPFPAIVARVVGASGEGVTLHRTYLCDGKKAPVPSPRKLMSGRPISGAAIRLFKPKERLGVAEGIETALAASVLFGVPVWSCINANGVESFESPDGVRSVVIFGDLDQNCVGQTAAYSAAKRLLRRGLTVEVCIPTTPGDWLDVLNEQQAAKIKLDTAIKAKAEPS